MNGCAGAGDSLRAAASERIVCDSHDASKISRRHGPSLPRSRAASAAPPRTTGLMRFVSTGSGDWPSVLLQACLVRMRSSRGCCKSANLSAGVGTGCACNRCCSRSSTRPPCCPPLLQAWCRNNHEALVSTMQLNCECASGLKAPACIWGGWAPLLFLASCGPPLPAAPKLYLDRANPSRLLPAVPAQAPHLRRAVRRHHQPLQGTETGWRSTHEM